MNPDPRNQEWLEAGTVWDLFELRAARTPAATMLIDGRRGLRITYAQALDIARRLAAGFLAQGIGPGSVVTWLLPTGLPAVMTALALARLGAVQNPVIPLYGEHELGKLLARNRPGFLLVPAADGKRDFPAEAGRASAGLSTPPRLVVMDRELPQGKPSTLPAPPQDGDAPRWIYCTSGSTAEPKGALHTDGTLILGGRNLARSMRVGADDMGTIAFPYAHIGGAMYTTMLLASGMGAVLLDRFEAAEAARTFARFGVTIAGGSTAHYLALLAEQERQPGQPLIPGLRLVCGGGAPCPPELHRRMRESVGCVLLHHYGMTEAPLVCAGAPEDGIEPLSHSSGPPVEGVELRIVAEDGRLAATGQTGEIRVRGAAVFKGYTDPALNQIAFDADGFFRTGDLGHRRADGRITLSGRLKDVIIRKGENISALELEQILGSHPKVGAVAVIGLPDAERGERVCAVVEIAQGRTPLDFDEMAAWFRQARVMTQKIPEQLEIVDRLPRSEAMQKVLKHELRAQFAR